MSRFAAFVRLLRRIWPLLRQLLLVASLSVPPALAFAVRKLIGARRSVLSTAVAVAKMPCDSARSRSWLAGHCKVLDHRLVRCTALIRMVCGTSETNYRTQWIFCC